MNSLFHSIVCILCLTTNNFETTFVTIGDYKDYPSQAEINLPECGLEYVPGTVRDIKFNDKCFTNKYPELNYTDFSEIDTLFNGLEVSYGESPWTVYIQDYFLPGIETSSCTGVLITREWVLTAAHCEKYFTSNDWIIFAGSNLLKRGEYIHGNPRKWWQHPVYAENKDKDTDLAFSLKVTHDIALIKLLDKFDIKRDGTAYQINTICLPKALKKLNNYSEPATFFGWGAGFDNVKSEKLKKGEIMLRPHSVCIKNNTLCTLYQESYEGSRVCFGDSGGPLVQYVKVNGSVAQHAFDNPIKAVLVGVTRSSSKFGDNKCKKEQLLDAWFIAVPRFIDWILSVIVSETAN